MNRLPLLFLGIFAAFASGWIGLVVLPYAQIGRLSPEVNAETGDVAPMPPSGLAELGSKVYAANGCAYCHTQQVLPENVEAYQSDVRRWTPPGRITVPRDYIYQNPVQLGDQRIGPDLSSVGMRLSDPNWHFRHLYNPRLVNDWSKMPSYRFLFVTRKITGQKADDALVLTGDDLPKPGYEVVPSYEAKALVAYLLSLNKSYALKEAPVAPSEK